MHGQTTATSKSGSNRKSVSRDWGTANLLDKWNLAEPLRIVDGAVEVVGGLVEFELAVAGGLLGSGEQGGSFGGGQRLETARSVKSLLDVGQRFAAGDDDTGGQIHGVVEALDGGKRIAAEKQFVAH